MKLPEGARVDLAHGEEQRIADAIEQLRKDPHAPRTISVTVTLHLHNEYPKHVAGKLVNSAEEEAAALAAAKKAADPEAPAEPTKPAEDDKPAEPAQ